MRPQIRKFLDEGFSGGSFFCAVQEFLSGQMDKGVSMNTISHLFATLHRMGKAWNNPQMSELNPYMVREYVDSLWLDYAPATVRGLVGDIKLFFKWAKKCGYCKKNLAKSVVKPKLRPGKNKAAGEGDVLRLVKFLADKLGRVLYRDLFGNLVVVDGMSWRLGELQACRDLFIILMLYESGCRAKEMCNLSTRAMQEACALASASGVYEIISIGKTNDRAIRFTNVTAEMWRVWYAVRPVDSKYAVVSWKNGGMPRPMVTNTIAQMFFRRCGQCGVGVFRSHSLRHLKVQRSRQKVGLDMANELMDHSTLVATQHYDFVRSSELTEATRVTGWVHGDIWR